MRMKYSWPQLLAILVVTVVASITKAASPEVINRDIGEVNTPRPMFTVKTVIVRSEHSIQVDDRELECMARNVYFEARGEGTRGMIAIAYVSKNRQHSTKWPGTICAVVYDRGKNGCEFSWTCDKIPDIVREQQSWKEALRIAHIVMLGQVSDPTEGAVYFHGKHLNIKRPNTIQTAIIGNHIFYRLAK